MAGTLINFVVDKYLSNILEIDKDKTTTSLMSGTVNMENLKIKKEIFNNLNLPYFEMVHGFVGSIKVEFSPLTFWRNPIVVKISKVFFMMKQKTLEKLNEDAEIKQMEDYKTSKLLSVEELRTQIGGVTSDPGMMEQIINNLRIEISEVNFRFEDFISYPGTPYVFGLVLKRLFIRSTNWEFDEDVDSVPVEDINYKIIKMDGLFLFMDYGKNEDQISYHNKIERQEVDDAEDMREFLGPAFDFYAYGMSEINHHTKSQDSHVYLLYNLIVTLQMSLNNKPKENLREKMNINLSLPEVNMNINLKQLSIVFKLLAYMSLNSLYRYGIYKKYYCKTPSEFEKKAYLEVYLTYFKAKYDKNHLNAKTATDTMNHLLILEKQLTYEQIASMREAAFIKFTYTSQLEAIDQEIDRIKSRWRVTSYFTSSSDETYLKELETRKARLKEVEGENLNKMEEALSAKKNLEDQQNEFKDMPGDWVMMRASVNVERVVLGIGETAEKKLLQFGLDGFITKAEIGMKFQYVTVIFTDFFMKQYKIENDTFPTIMESYNDPFAEHVDEGHEDLPEHNSALYIEFKMNPDFERSDMKFKLRNDKRLFIYANLYSLNYSSTKISEALRSDIDFDQVSKMASQEAAKYIKEGKNYANSLIGGDYKHFNIDADVQLKGPFLISPQNIHDSRNTKCLILSMGMLSVVSRLAERKKPDVDYKTLKELSMLYDVYDIDLKGFECLTMFDFRGPASIGNSQNKHNIINKININQKIAVILEPKNHFYENLVIEIKMNSVEFVLRDIQFLYFIEFLNHMNRGNALLQKELDENKLDIKENKAKLGGVGLQDQPSEEEKKIVSDEEKVLNSIEAKKKIRVKDILRFTFKLNRVDFQIQRSSSEEERVILESVSSYEANRFKNYLRFISNNFSIEVRFNNQKDMGVNLNLQNMFFFDSDFKFKLDEESRLTQEPLVNPEFNAIFGSINEEVKGHSENEPSRSLSLQSEAYDLDKNISDDKADPKRKVDFFSVSFDYTNETNESKIQINFSKLLVNLNFNSLERMCLYFKEFTDLNKEMASQNKAKILNARQPKPLIEEEKSVNNDDIRVKSTAPGKKNLFSKIKKKQEIRKQKETNDLAQGDLIREESNIDISSQVKRKEPQLTKSYSKSLMKVSFNMKEIEICIPLDHNSANTKVLKLNVNVIMKLKKIVEGDFYYDSFYLQKEHYYQNTMDFIFSMNNLDFDIVNFLNNKFVHNLSQEKVMLNSRISMIYKTFLMHEKESVISNVNLLIEPISLIVGFRQLRIFQDYLAIMQEFNKKLFTELLTQYEKEESQRNEIFTQVDKMEQERIRKERLNTAAYNQLMDVNLNQDKFVLKLIDNTNLYEIPLLKTELSKLSVKYITNSDPVDSDNVGLALVEIISSVKHIETLGERYQHHYNIYNLYQYINAYFSVEVASYNERLSAWEPIVEDWEATVSLIQVLKSTKMRVDIFSDKMVDMNFSFSSVVNVNTIMKLQNQKYSDWVDDERIKSQIQDEDEGMNEISLEVVNNLGIDCEFFFTASPSVKYSLEPSSIQDDRKATVLFTKNQMNNLYRNLSEEALLVKKDKLTLSLLGHKVKDVDFSFNHYKNYELVTKDKDKVSKKVEFSIIIKNNGIIKSIYFESNVSVFNNSKYEANLAFIESKYAQSFQDGGMNLSDANIITVQPEVFTILPLKYLIDSYMVFAELKYYKFGEPTTSGFKMLYSELNYLLAYSDDCKVMKDSQLSSKYSQTIGFEVEEDENNRTFSRISKEEGRTELVNLSFDVLVWNSLEDKEELEHKELNKDKYIDQSIVVEKGRKVAPNPKSEPKETQRLIYDKANAYTIVINPPFKIENQVPYNLVLKIGEDSQTEMIPLICKDLYYLDYSENRNDIKLIMDYHDRKTYASDKFSILDNIDKEDKKVIQLMDAENPSNMLNLHLSLCHIDRRNLLDVKYMKEQKFLSKSKLIHFYAEFLAVNRLSYDIKIKHNDKKDLENMRGYVFTAGQVNIYNATATENKAMIRADFSRWSEKFDVTTHGVQGVVCLEHIDLDADTQNKKPIKETEVATLITSSSSFDHSTIVIFEPRFLLVNKLGFPVKFRQQAGDLKTEEFDISPGEETVLTLTRFKKHSKYLTFSYGGQEGGAYTNAVNIDNIDDVNIAMEIPSVDSVKKDDPEDKTEYYLIGKNKLLVRVIIQTQDNGLIFVILTYPKYPQLFVDNQTSQHVRITQKKVKNCETMVIDPCSTSPFVWSDIVTPNEKALEITVGTSVKEFSFEKETDKNSLKLSENLTLYFNLELINNSVTRVLLITETEENESTYVKQFFIMKKFAKVVQMHLHLKGVGISLIDDTPKEIFYISIYSMDFRYNNNFLDLGPTTQNTTNIELYVKNFQIDYCLPSLFKLMLAPKTQLLPHTENSVDDEAKIPFFQLCLTKKSVYEIRTANTSTKITQIDCSIQELNVKVDQIAVNSLLAFMSSITGALDYSKTNPTEVQQKKRERDLQARDSLGMVIEKGEYCPMLSTSTPKADEILAQAESSNMIFLEALLLSALKINLTLRIDISSLDVKLVPGFVTKILGTLGNAVARITDSPLRFSEIIMQDCFTDTGKLVSLLTKHYTKQGVFQIYKILGSSDLIGNPIGFVDNVGAGFFEFFNEPRKGFLQGPDKFGKGLAKGK